MQPEHSRFAVAVAAPVAFLLAALSLGGILTNAYAWETPAWEAQAVGQDWFDLIVAVPWLLLCGAGARNGSYRWGVLLAGAYGYVVYEMVIYAFSIHFNSLFLVYVTTLGLAGWALIALALDLSRRIEPVDARGSKIGAWVLIAIGGLFSLLWLAEDLPAVLANRPPPTLVETALFTNPVHVIDLAFVLPAHVVAGVWLLKRRATGELLGPVVLAFGVLMAASIGGMMIVMKARGVAAEPVVTVAMLLTAAVTAIVLVRVLRGHPQPRSTMTSGAPGVG
ncbi:MAG: hypothetical protein JNL83_13600 [Myxococcales bacterium]|nr:hypothetical protein [Myxococcales bacterium]